MKKTITLILAMYGCVCLHAQSPWQSALKTCTSTNGVNFSTPTVFQDSSGVATAIRIGTSTSDTLISAFQWFPAPTGNAKWDKIAVKYSYDGGASWTTPTTCTFIGLPVGYQRPFDPSLIMLSNGQIRMFFSSSTISNPPNGGIDTYSGLSNDGKTYTFEVSPRFNDALKHTIDPTVAFFGSTFYYNSWSGTNSDGAHRAISNDGLSFTTQAVSAYDGTHLWLGNYLVDGSTLKFYGGGNSMWVNSSIDGVSWSTYTNIPIMGADPAVVKNKLGVYRIIYSGPPNVTGTKTNNIEETELSIFPSVFENFIFINIGTKLVDSHLEIYEMSGKLVHQSIIKKESNLINIDLSFLNAGVYYCKINNGQAVITKKIIKTNGEY